MALALLWSLTGGAPHAGAYISPTTGTAGAHGVLRGYDPPAQKWLRGHRGVDLSATVGSPILAAGAGTVAFSGTVAGTPTISLDHPDGIRTTYQPVYASVAEGESVEEGQPIGILAHPVDQWPGLHWGARLTEDSNAYLNPLSLLSQPTIRLKPIPPTSPA